MNDRLLLRKRVNISNEYIYFLCFIHPHYDIIADDGVHISDISDYDNINPSGIIYAAKYSDDIIHKLDSITSNWIIVSQQHYDVDLSTNEGLIKNLLPIHYAQIKNADSISVYNNMNYDALLNKIKLSLISNVSLDVDSTYDNNTLRLYESILLSQSVLNQEFFKLINKDNVDRVTSNVLTFLSKVQSNNHRSASVYYSRLIVQSNQKYGKRIKSAVSKFVKSRVSNKELSLYNLLMSINRAG